MSLHTTKFEESINAIETESNFLFELANSPKNYNSESAHLLNIVMRDFREQISYLREHQYIFGALS